MFGLLPVPCAYKKQGLMTSLRKRAKYLLFFISQSFFFSKTIFTISGRSVVSASGTFTEMVRSCSK